MEFSRGVRMIETGNWMQVARSKCLIGGRVSSNNCERFPVNFFPELRNCEFGKLEQSFGY